jgi:membrane protease YdiL (CAAX protease family)
MIRSNRSIFIAAIGMPLYWGLVSFLIFWLGPMILASIPVGNIPRGAWLWLICLATLIPFWRWMLPLRLEKLQRNLRVDSPRFYLIVAYLTALSALPMHGTWYYKWFAFGAIVSPIIEELFSRHMLTPWLRASFIKYLGIATLSSLTFSLMHWGYNSGAPFEMPVAQQLYKLWGHWQFAMLLALIFRFSRSLTLVILLHIASNLAWILSNT